MMQLIQTMARRVCATLSLALGLMASGAAHAENVFLIAPTQPADGIYSVDVTTGGPATRVVSLQGGQYNATLATRPTDGMLFWLDADASPPNLWRWDPSTPTVPPVMLGSPGNIQSVVRLAFDSLNRLLAMDRPSSALWELSQTNGSIVNTIPLSGTLPGPVSVGPPPTYPGGDLCLDPRNNTLYLTTTWELYTISTLGESTFLGPITGLQGTVGNNPITGCAVTVGGTLIVSQNNLGQLSTVNPLTLAATALPFNLGTSSPYNSIGDLSSTASGLSADLAVSKVALNATPGATVSFTVTITNNGPSKATDVRVLDTTPTGLTFLSATASQGTYSDQQTTVGVNTYPAGTWRIGTLTPNQTVTLTLNYQVTTGASITNTARISYNDMYDPVLSNNQASATVTPSVDLQIVKAATSSIGVGATATYSLTVRNAGFVPTTGQITVTDTLPTGMTLSATPSGTGWTCPVSGSTNSVGGNAVSCTSNTVIAAATTAGPAISGNPITVSVNVGSGTAQPTVTNTASVSGGGEPASNNGNNSGSDTSPVCPGPCVDLTPIKTVSASPLLVGSTATYTVTISNRGALASSGTYTFTDTLPAGLTLAAAPTTGAGWTCPAGSNTVGGTQVLCNSSTSIAGNGTSSAVTFTVNVGTAAYSSVTNSITVSGGGDTFAGNNTTTLTTPAAAADLSIAKVAGSSFGQGAASSYLLTVTNVGNTATIGNVLVSDNLPSPLTLSAAPTVAALNGGTVTGSCTGASGTANFTCTITSAVPVGGAFRITAPILNTSTSTLGTTQALSTVTNTATVSNPNEPPSLATTNNSATATDSANLVIGKSHYDPLSVNASSNYTITVSNSGTVAIGGTTRVTDTLPTGMTLSATPSGTGWTCTVAGQTNAVGGNAVSCTSTTVVAPGASLPQLTVPVTPSTNGSFTNTASVDNANEPLANRTDNSASDPTTVAPPPTWNKSFSPTSVAVGATSTLTFTITKPTSVTPLNGVNFIDPLPNGMTIASTPAPTNSCGGTLTAAAGDNIVTLSGGTFSTATCTITVPVIPSQAGSLVNTTGPLSTSNAGRASATTATLTVNAPTAPVLTKHSSPNPIAAGATSTLTFTIANKATNTTGVGFVDTLPTGVRATATPTAVSGCGAPTLNFSAGPPSTVTATGISLAANGNCVITVPITSSNAGSYANTSSNIGTITGGLDASKVSDTLLVRQATLTKAFSPTAVQPSTPATLTFTITNAAGQPQFSPLNFTETLPTNLVLAAAPTASQCNGSVSGTAGTSTITVANAGLVANQPNCIITAQVQSTQTGLYNNTSAQISNLSANLSNNVNASLAVFTTPTVTKTVAVLNDPFNGTTNPKAIPGAEMEYTVTFNNASATSFDNNSIVITDVVPANTSLFMGGSPGPITLFSASGITAPVAADITYSNSASAPYSFTYTPSVVNNYDPAITAFQINLKGALAANTIGTLKFKVKVR